MDIRQYLHIIRRRWWIVAALPLLVALISGASALARPARYGIQMRLLVTRAAGADGAAGRTAAGEDTTAQDLPAILKSAAFRDDLARELARHGQPADSSALVDAISATTSAHEVAATVADARPEQALAIAQALVAVLQTQGLRYWGDPSATPAHPGLEVGVLDLPAQAVRQNGLRAGVLEVGLRTLAGLGAAVGLAIFLYDIERRAGA